MQLSEYTINTTAVNNSCNAKYKYQNHSDTLLQNNCHNDDDHTNTWLLRWYGQKAPAIQHMLEDLSARASPPGGDAHTVEA
eukprot:2114662-Pyramimonas_sp.AAC.1